MQPRGKKGKQVLPAVSANSIDVSEQKSGKPSTPEAVFEIERVLYRRGIKLNEQHILRDACGDLIISFGFASFADERCTYATRTLAEKLGLKDPTEWRFKLAELEMEAVGWSRQTADPLRKVTVLTSQCF
jgi:hypothetical protein